MEIKKQLAIFLANTPGAFQRVCEALDKEKIKILAMSVSDTIDHSVLRLVVEDPHRAVHLLEEAGLMVLENEVLLVEMEHGKLSYSHLAKILGQANINIEYAYSSSVGKKFSLVVRVHNPQEALDVLKKNK
jgi:hypothetical protein